MSIDIIHDDFDVITVTVGLPGQQGPAGPQGPTGATGATGPSSVLSIGTVITGDEGDPAAASLTGTSPSQVLNLTIPRGLTGAQGPQGEPGVDGAGIAIAGAVATYAALPSGLGSGDAGKAYIVDADGKLYIWSGTSFPANGAGTDFRGPVGPANTLTVGTVTTGAAGSSASANITGTAPNQVVSFSIPRGDTGATGAAGPGVIPGGVTDSVLVKASGSDYDTDWTMAVSSPDGSTIIKRDVNGRAQVVSPSTTSDIATKGYVDTAVATASDNNATVNAATSVPTPSTLMKRDINGRAQVVDPVSGADIATKTYADSVGTSAATVGSIMRRDVSGRAKVIDPAVGTDIANKQYVDALGVSTATSSAIMRRDSSGRAQITSPAVASDIANKQYVDDIAGSKVGTDEVSGYVSSSIDMAPIIRRHNGTSVAVRPPTSRPVWWIVPNGFTLPLTGTTAGGSVAAVNNLDLVSRYS